MSCSKDQEPEQTELEGLFKSREPYGPAVSGEDLRRAAKFLFEENKTAIEGYLSEDGVHAP